jgi:cardiolipin synthase
MSLRFLPNLLCIFRIMLVYPTAHGILQGQYSMVLALDWATELGKHLDPAADKLLMVSTFVCLSIAGLAPWWLTGLVLMRDLVIVCGAIAYRVLFGPLQGNPTVPSKFNTLCQVAFCLAVISRAAYGWPPEPFIVAAGALVLVTTSVSGLDYVMTYTRRASAAARARRVAAG